MGVPICGSDPAGWGPLLSNAPDLTPCFQALTVSIAPCAVAIFYVLWKWAHMPPPKHTNSRINPFITVCLFVLVAAPLGVLGQAAVQHTLYPYKLVQNVVVAVAWGLLWITLARMAKAHGTVPVPLRFFFGAQLCVYLKMGYTSLILMNYGFVGDEAIVSMIIDGLQIFTVLLTLVATIGGDFIEHGLHDYAPLLAEQGATDWNSWLNSLKGPREKAREYSVVSTTNDREISRSRSISAASCARSVSNTPFASINNDTFLHDIGEEDGCGDAKPNPKPAGDDLSTVHLLFQGPRPTPARSRTFQETFQEQVQEQAQAPQTTVEEQPQESPPEETGGGGQLAHTEARLRQIDEEISKAATVKQQLKDALAATSLSHENRQRLEKDLETMRARTMELAQSKVDAHTHYAAMKKQAQSKPEPSLKKEVDHNKQMCDALDRQIFNAAEVKMQVKQLLTKRNLSNKERRGVERQLADIRAKIRHLSAEKVAAYSLVVKRPAPILTLSAPQSVC